MKLRWLVAASGLAAADSMFIPAAQAAPSVGFRDLAPDVKQTSGVEQTHYRRHRHYRYYRYYRRPGVHFYLGHRHHRGYRHW